MKKIKKLKKLTKIKTFIILIKCLVSITPSNDKILNKNKEVI